MEKDNLFTRFLKLVLNLQEGSTNDTLGAYPVRVHVPAMPERRYLNTTRSMTLASVVSLCFTAILAIILFLLPPQIRSVPRFLVLNQQDYDVTSIGRFTARISARYMMTERLIADYVKERVSAVPNVEAMKAKYEADSPLMLVSSQSLSYTTKSDSERLLADVQNHGLRREVKILWVRRMFDNTWRVRYETTDTYRDRSEPEVNSWLATIKVAYRPGAYTKEQRLLNPFGFTVMDFKDARAANRPEDAERFDFEE